MGFCSTGFIVLSIVNDEQTTKIETFDSSIHRRRRQEIDFLYTIDEVLTLDPFSLLIT